MAKENSFAYVAEVVRCHASAAKTEALKAYRANNPDDGGLLVRLVHGPRGPL